MEQPHNEEGLKMHHVGDGSSFVSVTGDEYFDIFPVWDWQKIPGTTVVQKPVLPHWKHIARRGLTDFVGGVSDGKYGAVAMDFKSAHDPLQARKAWFFFDDEYVCLGSSITAQADYPVVTTLNQCLLDSNVVVRSKKAEVTLHKGVHSLAQVSWIFHDSVGYVFTAPQKVNIGNTTSTGKWSDINHQASASADPVSKEVFSAWLDHGVRPQSATYEYIVLPASTPGQVDRYAKDSPVEILANSSALQAVHHRALSRTAIVFYEPGTIRTADNVSISANSACVVMARTNGKGIEELVVSDPTQKLAKLQLRVSAMIEVSGANWTSSWDKKEKQSVIDIELPQAGYAGQSVVLAIPLPQ
jgi:chondroitin AC lyase